MRVISSMWIAFSTYSRIPVPRVEWSDENRKYTMCFFPLIGAAVGAVVWLWLWLCDVLAIGAFLRGAVGALLPLLVTGGIHMDGLMDTSDALASWQSKERRLEILKDSHTGAFAVIVCAGYLLASAGLLSEATSGIGPVLVPCFMVSRALSAWAMASFQSARPSGMLDGFARAAHKRVVAVSSMVYLTVSAVLWGWTVQWLALAGILAAGLCLLWYWRMAYHYFGGVTGDLAGWFVQITEICLCAVMILGGKIG